MKTEFRYIDGKQFLDALSEAGVIDNPYDEAPTRDEKIRRVVIDATVGEPVRLYVERYGDERLLSVASALAETRIEERAKDFGVGGWGGCVVCNRRGTVVQRCFPDDANSMGQNNGVPSWLCDEHWIPDAEVLRTRNSTL